MRQTIYDNRMPIKIFSLIFIIIYIAACTRKISDNVISLEDPHIDTVHLEPYYEWNPLIEREAVLERIERYGDTNLFNLYGKYDYNMLWIDNGSLNSNARQLIYSLSDSWKEGLNNEDYYIKEIYNYIDDLKGKRKYRLRKMKNFSQLDILFTNAYLGYASDLLSGRVDPGTLDSIWEAHPRDENLIIRLEKALHEGTITQSLAGLRPENPQYDKLASKLEDYLSIKNKGGWTIPGYFPPLAVGDSNENVIKVKGRLMETGDLRLVEENYMKSGLFDHQLKLAVIKYQQRHGLVSDGMVGKETLAQMNKPVDYRINQIRVNMERIRWLPGSFGEKYILVNLPEYKLKYYEKGYLLEEMKIVIGEIEYYTPVLKDTLKYIVFNPSWNVPRSIVVKEKLPRIKEDSTYLKRFDYILLKGSYTSTDKINPDSVNWSDINKDNFPFYMVQKPGKHNALGKVKFLFPNHQAIYLHDTPSKHLFDVHERNFSYGCIRLERPFELAQTILKGQMTRQEIQDIIESEEITTVTLSEMVNVHFLYFTAWVDDKGSINFRKDLYNFDKMTLEKF